jgi:hypothetical protein
MFAIPFTASSTSTLVPGLLGRFLSKTAPPATGVVAMQAAPVEVELAEEAFPDLAQRVREVGEW